LAMRLASFRIMVCVAFIVSFLGVSQALIVPRWFHCSVIATTVKRA